MRWWIPLEFSTGIKIKVAEALAWNVPVLATRDAFDGFRAYQPYRAANHARRLVRGKRLDDMPQPTGGSRGVVIRERYELGARGMDTDVAGRAIYPGPSPADCRGL